MIDIIDKHNKYIFAKELDEMFAMRYRILVEKWGWNIPDIEKGYDKDKFDTDDTVYFLAYDNDGHVNACARLNPTEKPHLLSEVFASQCEFNGVPISEDTYEFTRFVIDGAKLTNLEQLQLGFMICLAVTEYTLDNKIKKFSILVRKESYARITVVWKISPLGLPQYYEDDDANYLAGICEVSDDSAKRLQEFARVKGRASQYGGVSKSPDFAR